MTETTGKELYGNSETWREVYKASQAIEGFSDYFREMIRSKIDFSKLKTLLQNDDIKVNIYITVLCTYTAKNLPHIIIKKIHNGSKIINEILSIIKFAIF